jgi:hypothetical protein
MHYKKNCAGAENPTNMELLHSRVFYFCRTCGSGFSALPNAAQAHKVQEKWRRRTHIFSVSSGNVAQASVHSQMLRRRRESNKDGAFTLICFPFLQDTWPWLLCTLKCCAGAESLTKMALSQSHASYFFRSRGPGFCELLFLQDTWPCTIKNRAGAESLTKMAVSHSRVFYFCRSRGPGFCALPNAAQAQRISQNSLGQSVQRVHLPQLDPCCRDDTMPDLEKLAPLLYAEFTMI